MTTKDYSGSIRRRKPKKFRNLSEIDIEERRHTANIQERTRMKKLSKALDELRKCIPNEYHLSNRKMSKIRTLRLATKYIASLSEIIQRDNLVRQQAFLFETQMMQSTYSYLVPTPPLTFPHGYPSGQRECPGSPYTTPSPLTSECRLSKRQLDFSHYVKASSKHSQDKEAPNTPIKPGIMPFRKSMPYFRNPTSTITSPSMFCDVRNMNELNVSIEGEKERVKKPTGPESGYTCSDGRTQERRFYRWTDCSFDPRRLQKEQN